MWIYSKRIPVELANTNHIKVIFFMVRVSINIGPVAQCTCFYIFSTYLSNIKEPPRRFPGIVGNAGNHENDGKFHESHKILNQI